MSKFLIPLFLFFTINSFAQNPVKIAKNTDLETIRQRIINDLLEPEVNEKEVEKLMQTIKPDGSWSTINYEDVSKTGFQHSQHLENMVSLSRAYKKSTSKFRNNPKLKSTISAALNFWIEHDFICENWWWNEMGTPDHIIDILLIMDNDLTEKQKTEGLRIAGRASLEGFGARPGGDLIKIAGMLGKQGLFKRDEQVLTRVVKVMADEIKISSGRGLNADLSFHHRTDGVISTLSYGTNYADAFAYWAVKTTGTEYALPAEKVRLLVDYYLDGICRSMIYGKYPDPGAKNRGITRKGALSPAGPELPENLLLATDYRKAELEEIVRIRKNEKKPNLKSDYFFWHSEYFVHQRPDYFASVRMHSDRNYNMEQPYNEEGLKNHHYADGSNFISRTGKEYFNIFPVWNWQKIPGTTTVQKPALPHWDELAKKGLKDFVGGVTDGEYGAAAFDFQSPHDPLQARKSWFFFDKEYVCLGTGIYAESEYPVATTINQCLLNQDVMVKSRNKQETLPKGDHTLGLVSWVLHDSIAYLFPSPTNLMLRNATENGSWRQINHQAWATEEEVKKDVFTLWFDHGTKPQNASYEYIVLPDVGAAEVESYKKNPEITVLANTSSVQAVKHNRLNRTQIVFYKAGDIKITDGLTITADKPCMVIIKTNNKTIEQLAVSDPTRKLSSVNLKVTSQIKGSGDNWNATWNKDKKSSIIQVDLPKGNTAGKSVVMEI